VASRNAKYVCDEGLGVGPSGLGVYLDLGNAIREQGRDVIGARYENLFSMYERITGESPWSEPMRIYPAPHYTMGGLWVDYDLMTTVPGLFAIGEANFSDHGANRLGASALMQCLADGYFIVPLTIGDFLSRHASGNVDTDHPACADAERGVKARIDRLLSIGGSSTVASLHRELGRRMWDHCGIARNGGGLREALTLIPALRERFWNDLRIVGSGERLNQSLEHAGRLADFLEFAELMCRDALERNESCGCHFREEFQTEEGETLRNDVDFAHVSVWEHTGDDQESRMHKEQLTFHALPVAQRNYKT
jgi:succinate dehydrogenase / fumarate reductase flavoprotein subunit